MDFKKQFLTIFVGATYDMPINVPSIGAIEVIATPLSASNYAQARKEKYPVFSISDTNPLFSSLYHNDVFNYEVIADKIFMIPDVLDENTQDPVEHKAVFKRSFLMEFGFDVTFATKKVSERDAVRNLFLKTFGNKGFLTFLGYPDYEVIEEGTPRHYETVEYTMERGQIDRADGVLQDTYQFLITAWISSSDPELLPLVKELNVLPTIKISI